jgi:Glycosyl hydrolase family 26
MLRRVLVLALVILLVVSPFVVLNVSASSNQIFWGAWVGNSHIGNYSLLTSFESQVGKDVSIWNWIQLWNRPQDSDNVPTFDTALMEQCRNHGAIPMVSWGPEASDGDSNFVNLQSILDGKEDAYLTVWGQASAAWGHPYFVRLMWEFTGSWTDNTAQNPGYGYYPWGNSNTPALFVQAWQYIVDKVREAGGTNISWIWCPADVGDSVGTLQSLYPGDNYVDWVGTDVYCSTGQSFSSVSQPELNNIRTVAPNKPVMLPELGYSGSNTASWWSNFFSELPTEFSYIEAFAIWEMPSAGLTVVDSNTLSTFKQGIATSYFSSNNFSTLNLPPVTAIQESPNPTSSPTSTTVKTPSTATYASITVATVLIATIATTAAIKVKKSTNKKGGKGEKQKRDRLNLFLGTDFTSSS